MHLNLTFLLWAFFFVIPGGAEVTAAEITRDSRLSSRRIYHFDLPNDHRPTRIEEFGRKQRTDRQELAFNAFGTPIKWAQVYHVFTYDQDESMPLREVVVPPGADLATFRALGSEWTRKHAPVTVSEIWSLFTYEDRSRITKYFYSPIRE